MSDYEAEARYEHATTILDWNAASDEPPNVVPPSDDDGWMLFSQNPAKAVELHENGVPVTRFLCVWRRRLTRVDTKKPTKAESMAAWKAKREEEAKKREAEQAEDRKFWQQQIDRDRAEKKAAKEKEIQDAWHTSPRLWELIGCMNGIRVLAFDTNSNYKWKVFFVPGTSKSERVNVMKQVNKVTKGIRPGYFPVVDRVDTGNVHGLIFMASNDVSLPVSVRVMVREYADSVEISAFTGQPFGAVAGESAVANGPDDDGSTDDVF